MRLGVNEFPELAWDKFNEEAEGGPELRELRPVLPTALHERTELPVRRWANVQLPCFSSHIYGEEHLASERMLPTCCHRRCPGQGHGAGAGALSGRRVTEHDPPHDRLGAHRPLHLFWYMANWEGRSRCRRTDRTRPDRPICTDARRPHLGDHRNARLAPRRRRERRTTTLRPLTRPLESAAPAADVYTDTTSPKATRNPRRRRTSTRCPPAGRAAHTRTQPIDGDNRAPAHIPSWRLLVRQHSDGHTEIEEVAAHPPTSTGPRRSPWTVETAAGRRTPHRRGSLVRSRRPGGRLRDGRRDSAAPSHPTRSPARCTCAVVLRAPDHPTPRRPAQLRHRRAERGRPAPVVGRNNARPVVSRPPSACTKSHDYRRAADAVAALLD